MWRTIPAWWEGVAARAPVPPMLQSWCVAGEKGGLGVLALFREGFWRDALALVIVAVVLGGLAVGAIGRGVEAYLTRAVSGLVGAPGEFDAVVHVRQDTGEQALRLLGERLAQSYPGFVYRPGPVLAGYRNEFIRFP